MATNPIPAENDSWSSFAYNWTVRPAYGAANTIYSQMALGNPASENTQIVDIQRRMIYSRRMVAQDPEPLLAAAAPQIPAYPIPPLAAHEYTNISLADQERATAKTDLELAALAKKVSMRVMLTIMKKDLTPHKIWAIERRASEPNFSLINVFLEEAANDLTLWSRLLAQITYFFLYDSKIISNTIETIAKGAMEKIRFETHKNGGENLKKLVEKGLKSIDAFLADYLKQIEAFSEGEGDGTCDDFLTKKLKTSDIDIYKFTKIAIQEFAPKISFLKTWKESESLLFYIFICIPIKLLMYIPEAIGNSVLRHILKNEIQSFVKEVIDEKLTKENISFYISITDIIVKCLTKVEEKLSKKELNFTGTTIISPVFKKSASQIASQLLTISELPEARDRKNLKDYFEQSEKNNAKKNSLNKTIQESIVKGTHNLVNYLSNVNNSELFYFNLINNLKSNLEKPSLNTQNPNQLINKYNASKNEMSKKSTRVFKLAIGNILTQSKMEKSINSLKKNKKIFTDDWKNYTTRFFEVLEAQNNQTKEKINASLTLPNPEQEIFPYQLNEIVDELDKIQAELENYINAIEADLSAENFKTVLNENKDKSEEIIKQIKELKDNRNRKYATFLALNDMNSLNRALLIEDPIPSMWNNWPNILEEHARITKDNEYNYPEINELNILLNSMKQNYNNSIDENKILLDLNPIGVGPTSLMNQLHQQIDEKIRTNKNSYWISRQISGLKSLINTSLTTILPKEEHKEERKNLSDRIEALIRCNTEIDADTMKDDLIREFNRIVEHHEQNKEASKVEWNRQSPILKRRVADSIKNLRATLELTKKIIPECLKEIDTLIQEAKEQVINIQPHKITDKNLIEAAGGYGTIVGTIIGGGITYGVSSYFGINPLIVSSIGTGAGYLNGEKLLMGGKKFYSDKMVVPKVNDVFEKLHGFFVEKHLPNRLVYELINSFMNKYTG